MEIITDKPIRHWRLRAHCFQCRMTAQRNFRCIKSRIRNSESANIAVVILYILVHEIEGYDLVPKIMEKTVGTSPLLTLLALLIGYQLAGILGLIISVPLATAITVVVQEFWPGKGGA